MWNEFLQHDLGWYEVLVNKRHMYALYEVLWGLFPTRQLAADLRLIGRHLLIPGFHAFALALQGLMDVYESGLVASIKLRNFRPPLKEHS